MIIEICIAIIALAFVALVITVIVLAKGFQKTLVEVNQTLAEVRKELDGLGGKTSKVIEHTNQVSYDLKRKLESLDPIFNTLFNVGDFLEHKTFALRKEALASTHETLDETASQESIKAGDVLELMDIGIRLWQKIKKRRKQ